MEYDDNVAFHCGVVVQPINRLSAIVGYIEITSWLVSAYDFYSRVVKNRKRTSERSERVSLRFFTTSE